MYYMVLSVTLGFMQSAIVGQSEGLSKKWLIWLIWKVGVIVRVPSLCVIECLCAGGGVARAFVYVLACIFSHTHIFPLSVDGKGSGMNEESVKREIVEEGGGNTLLQSHFLFLSNFTVALSSFWFEYEMSVFFGGGNFIEWRWWFKLKSSSRYFFSMWLNLWVGNKNDRFLVSFAIIYIYIYIKQ